MELVTRRLVTSADVLWQVTGAEAPRRYPESSNLEARPTNSVNVLQHGIIAVGDANEGAASSSDCVAAVAPWYLRQFYPLIS